MNNRKATFHFFTIAGFEEEEEYLCRMHKRGWEFTGVNFPGIYHFIQCQPENVIYQLDYNPNGRYDNEYTQLFEDCGWEYLQDFFGYSYFRKPASEMKEKEKIFSDNRSKLDMLRRVFNSRVTIMIVLFFTVICPQLVLQAATPQHFYQPLFIIYCVLFMIYVTIFIKFAFMYHRCKKRNG